MVHIKKVGLNEEKVFTTGQNRSFYERGLYIADKSIFNVFTFNFIYGNPEFVFKDPNSLVITKSTAEKYFGSEMPVGKKLIYEYPGAVLPE